MTLPPDLAHIPCRRCGYDTFGLNRVGPCPECGLPISTSWDGRSLLLVPHSMLIWMRFSWILGLCFHIWWLTQVFVLAGTGNDVRLFCVELLDVIGACATAMLLTGLSQMTTGWMRRAVLTLACCLVFLAIVGLAWGPGTVERLAASSIPFFQDLAWYLEYEWQLQIPSYVSAFGYVAVIIGYYVLSAIVIGWAPGRGISKVFWLAAGLTAATAVLPDSFVDHVNLVVCLSLAFAPTILGMVALGLALRTLGFVVRRRRLTMRG